MDSRAVGRPRRGEQEVGASKIVERARAALRHRYFDVSSRKMIAERCGVTPALITYYFPNREELLRRILLPVLDAQVEQLHTLVNAEEEFALEDLIDRVVSILRDYRNFFRAFDFLVAAGIIVCREDYVQRLTAEIRCFVRYNTNFTIQYPFCERSFHGAIWGMCKLKADMEVETERDLATDVAPAPRSFDENRYVAAT